MTASRMSTAAFARGAPRLCGGSPAWLISPDFPLILQRDVYWFVWGTDYSRTTLCWWSTELSRLESSDGRFAPGSHVLTNKEMDRDCRDYCQLRRSGASGIPQRRGPPTPGSNNRWGQGHHFKDQVPARTGWMMLLSNHENYIPPGCNCYLT
jgi:hypothetical protein